MKTILLFLLFLVSSPSFAITEAEAIANWDRSIKQLKVNALLARVDTSIPSGTTAANTFGNLALKGTSVDSLALASKGALTVGGKPLVVDVEAKLLKPSVIGAFGRFAKKVIPVLNTGVALYDLTNELSGWSVDKGEDGKPKFTKTIEGEVCQSDCFEYRVTTLDTWVLSPEAACRGYVGRVSGVGGYTRSFVSMTYNPTAYEWTCKYTESRPAIAGVQSAYSGTAERVGVLTRPIPPFNTASTVPATAEEWADEVGKKSYSPTLSKLIRDVISSGEEIETSPPNATGPATTPGTTTTTTGTAPDGTPTTTTTTNTNHYTYAGDNITHNTTSTTETCTGAGSCSTTTTTTENQPSAEPVPEEPEPIEFDEPFFPPIPELYTPKYPDGLIGVWAEKKAALMSSPLLNLLSRLMPSGLDSGTCPTLVVPLDVGLYDFGSHDFAPPCWIWTFGKVVIVISALLLARALIFGG